MKIAVTVGLCALLIAVGALLAKGADPVYWVEHGTQARCVSVTDSGPGSSAHVHACEHHELPLYDDESCSIVSTHDPCAGLDFQEMVKFVSSGEAVAAGE